MILISPICNLCVVVFLLPTKMDSVFLQLVFSQFSSFSFTTFLYFPFYVSFHHCLQPDKCFIGKYIDRMINRYADEQTNRQTGTDSEEENAKMSYSKIKKSLLDKQNGSLYRCLYTWVCVCLCVGEWEYGWVLIQLVRGRWIHGVWEKGEKVKQCMYEVMERHMASYFSSLSYCNLSAMTHTVKKDQASWCRKKKWQRNYSTFI